MSRVIPLVFALLWFASSQAGVPPPPIAGTQVRPRPLNLQ
jgi:hypothetical protein